MNTDTEGFRFVSGGGHLAVPGWEHWPWLIHGFSTRQGGVSTGPFRALNLGNHVGDNPDLVRENRRRWLACLRAETCDEVYMQQVHGNNVVVVDHSGSVPAADGILTNRPGLVLHVLVADCLPILMFDPVTESVGAVHAGWRGTVANIVGKAVDGMVHTYGVQPANLRVAVGPGIGHCCYKVDAPVIDAVSKLTVDWRQAVQAADSANQWLLSLPVLNALLLREAGVEDSHISYSNLCTFDLADQFFSYRRDKGCTGRMAGSIAIKATGKLDT